jgi:hypothetical protein
VAVPAAGRSLLGQQNFMVNIQAPAGVNFTSAAPGASHYHSSSSSLLASSLRLASPSAAAASSPMKQQQGSAGRQQLPQQQQQQQVLSALVTAWQELVLMLHKTRLRGLYCLLPDLVGAVAGGDDVAAYVFKNVS